MILPIGTFLAFVLPVLGGFDDFGSFSLSDSILQEVINRAIPRDYSFPSHEERSADYPSKAFEARRDSFLNKEPSIRDKEYLEHSSLFGHKFLSGGAGEGLQRLRPDGSIENMQIVKTDGTLPAYCSPPNPCPSGYTAEDGCLDNFENTASFSREYQASQVCMCDSEHMFDCPGASRDSEIDALARTFENEGLADVALDRLMKTMEIEGEHKIVAKKFFSHKPLNPFLEGEKLPVVAKKAPQPSIM